VLPKLGAANAPAGVTAVPVTSPTPQRSIYAVVQESTAATPAARAALGALARCARGGA